MNDDDEGIGRWWLGDGVWLVLTVGARCPGHRGRGQFVGDLAIRYPQVSNLYTPSAGYPAGHGRAVLCAWAAVALALAVWTLNRRDA